jgi:predicted transcriptional regulator
VNWKKLLTELIDSGMTQAAIAEEIGVSQSRIAQVVSSTPESPHGFRYEPGEKLVSLHRGRVIEASSETR